MQNYGQSQGYQRPGSTTSFAGQQPPPPPAYGGYQSTAPQQQSQWAPPTQNPAPSQQWNQPPQQSGVYNPGTYGVMPGGQQAYPPQQHDPPPPPPPKPYGFAGAVQQQQQQNQGWAQHQQGGGQTPQQQGGYPVPHGGQNQQQQYNSTAPPPPSATPGGSYFPPAQGGRPGSIYGANQASSMVGTPVNSQQQNSVISPNEQQPAYIPPSLTGQGVQAYMPSNTNPMPGVYVPPPPDIPAWQQAQHAPLQGVDKKFKYTKPSVDPSFYAQGYQGVQPMQQQQQLPPLPPRPNEQYAQSPAQHRPLQQPWQQQTQHQTPQQVTVPHQQQQAPSNQYQQQQQLQGPYGQLPPPPPPQPYSQSTQGPQPPPPDALYGAANVPKPYALNQGASNVSKPHAYEQYPTMASNVSKPYAHAPEQNQWVPHTPASQDHDQSQETPQAPYGAQQQWQPGHNQSLPSVGGQGYQGAGHDIEAPKPLNRTDTASPAFFNQPSPQSQPASPVSHRQSMSFNSNQQTGLGRTGSVSSIALANLHAQREGGRTSSPKPPPPKLPTPPPPRDDKSKFSALGSGGPSDWEHFGGDVEVDDEEIFTKKNEPAQLDSVELPASQPELPAGPSPPSTHGWPSPAIGQATAHSSGRQDTYQPTPSPTVAQLAQQPSIESPQGFMMGDAAPAPLRLSPKPLGEPRPSSTQQDSAMGDGAWQPPKQGTPAQHQSQHQPPSTSQGFVMDDGSVACQSTPAQGQQSAPVQHQQHAPGVTTNFVMGDGDWGTSQRTPTQEKSGWGTSTEQSAELKAKDAALESLRTQAEKDKADLHTTIDRLKADLDGTRTQLEDEKAEFREQIEAMRTSTEEAKTKADAALKDSKEKDMTIERLKEDVEGREHNIIERDATIADLKRQLEDEKTKELPKTTPAPADLIPEIDPWYAGSLARYIAMLREAHEVQIEDKIRTFKAFLKAESEIRGIPYYDAPPVPVPAASNMSKPVATDRDLDVGFPTKNASSQLHNLNVDIPVLLQGDDDDNYSPGGASNMSKPAVMNRDLSAGVPVKDQSGQDCPGTSGEGHQLNVTVPIAPPEDDEYDYSPGGRPVLKRKSTLPSGNDVSFARPSNTSAQSTTILTPTSSVGDDTNKTPVQSPPEEKSQPQYKAYVPPAATTTEPGPISHRQSTSFSSIAPLGPPIGAPSSTGKGHDEIFFGAHKAEKPGTTSRPNSSDSASREVSTPAPLSFTPNRAASTAPPSKRDPAETLANLLPSRVAPVSPSHCIREVRGKLALVKNDAGSTDELTKTWEKSAALARRKNDDARRKRQEEQEEINNELFETNEISYAGLNQLEDDFNQKEEELKAKEHRLEYESYIETVFDRVYDDLQADIKVLMDLYVEAENLLHTSTSGVRSLEGGDVVGTQESLELLKDLHERILERQNKVVQAVAERDRRYKKTEIQPLYAAGNITKMKAVEKHFENAEKQAIVRAKRDTAGRVGELVTVAEDVVVNAVGVDQHEIDSIVSALYDLGDGAGNEELVTRAHDTLAQLKSSSKSLLKLLNTMELDLNTAVSDAELAQAKAENADASQLQQLESKKAAEEKKLKEEFERKITVLDQDTDEIDTLIEEKGGKVQLSEEQEKEKRLKAALEAAKKRNGHA